MVELVAALFVILKISEQLNIHPEESTEIIYDMFIQWDTAEMRTVRTLQGDPGHGTSILLGEDKHFLEHDYSMNYTVLC